ERWQERVDRDKGRRRPRPGWGSQSPIVVKYDGAIRWSDLTSALLPTFASSMAWFALGITTRVKSRLPAALSAVSHAGLFLSAMMLLSNSPHIASVGTVSWRSV